MLKDWGFLGKVIKLVVFLVVCPPIPLSTAWQSPFPFLHPDHPVTFIEHRHSHDQPVQPHGGVGAEVGEHVRDSRGSEEQVHGAVLPVHQLHPVALLGQVEVGPIWNKLLCQDPCRETGVQVGGRAAPGQAAKYPKSCVGGCGSGDLLCCLRCSHFGVK